MQLTLTLMSSTFGFEKDIMVNSQQKIKETILILLEAGAITGAIEENYKVRSRRTSLFLQPEMTYEQAGIYYGDVIEIS